MPVICLLKYVSTVTTIRPASLCSIVIFNGQCQRNIQNGFTGHPKENTLKSYKDVLNLSSCLTSKVCCG